MNQELAEPPSAYLARQIHATFQDDPVAIHNLPLTGAASLIWGSDYPHHEGTYPYSRQTVARLSEGISTDDAARVVPGQRRRAVPLRRRGPHHARVSNAPVRV